jgi:phage repressor protein C with HTH and peptisase S24 domain
MSNDAVVKTAKACTSVSEPSVGTFADRLKDLMGADKESQFAQKCHIPLSTMRKYLNGSTPGLDKAVQIARLNGVSLTWLATGEGESTESEKDPESLSEQFVMIPGYSQQVSAGHGSSGRDNPEPVRELAFSRHWLRVKGFDPKALAVVWAKGDSMHPTISDNDSLVVHLNRKVPRDGYIYVFRNGDELYVKRYQHAVDAWRLISDNSLYPPLDIPKQEQHQFDVIGQVVHVAKDIAD